MRAEILLIPLIVCIAVVFGACQKSSHASQTNISFSSAPKPNNTISYKGVSFTFDPSLAPDVKSETLPAVTDGKPCDIVPEHFAFTLIGYPRPSSMAEKDPQIRVFSIAKFRNAMHLASQEMAKNTIPPTGDWGPGVDEEVRVLRALLEKQPKFEELREFLSKTRSPEARQLNNFPQMPFLPMWEASQAFFARPKYLRFMNGQGVFFLTQWNVSDTYQITNDGLEYAFQGITDDGQYLIYAEFSVKAPFLPSDDDPEVVAWNEKHYMLPQNSKTYQDYLKPIVAKLQGRGSDQFRPNLTLLEQLITSMEVKPN